MLHCDRSRRRIRAAVGDGNQHIVDAHAFREFLSAAAELDRRLSAAATMLDETAFSTREIAALLGFCDEHHLIRHFRSNFGCTPRRYRDRNN